MSQEMLMQLSQLVNQYSPDDITLKEARVLSGKLAEIIADPRSFRIDKVRS